MSETSTKQRILERWQQLGYPDEAAAIEFMAVSMVSKTALSKAREQLGISTRQEGRSWVWSFSNVERPKVEETAEPEPEDPEPAYQRPLPTSAFVPMMPSSDPDKWAETYGRPMEPGQPKKGHAIAPDGSQWPTTFEETR